MEIYSQSFAKFDTQATKRAIEIASVYRRLNFFRMPLKELKNDKPIVLKEN